MADEIQDPNELGIKKIFKKPDEVEEIIDYILENAWQDSSASQSLLFTQFDRISIRWKFS